MKNVMIAVSAVALGASFSFSETGVAKIKGTAEGSAISGTVTFQDTHEGLKVSAQLAGVAPGDHGFHIHEFGSCEEAGKAAGGHYNPLRSPHGHVKSGLKKAHAGDLGNITAGPDGKAFLEVVLPKKIALTGGKYDAAGRAVILHEKADDFGQPLGNAGGRIGCGVIVIGGP